ncbi:hypothetical protein [Salmonirosea aquatica]|uniref:Uncharacterized protein n=1 Tax=Salmonirosea aquatica TaxID=2654236 RepID=A0A7C9BCW8_9BACT|nr:hypothetical protein [Cytophagaceae bacterium SJW1-29]
MTTLLFATTPGTPMKSDPSSLLMPRLVGTATFMLGILTMTPIISIFGWPKSRKMGIATTPMRVVALISIILMSIV